MSHAIVEVGPSLVPERSLSAGLFLAVGSSIVKALKPHSLIATGTIMGTFFSVS